MFSFDLIFESSLKLRTTQTLQPHLEERWRSDVFTEITQETRHVTYQGQIQIILACCTWSELSYMKPKYHKLAFRLTC